MTGYRREITPLENLSVLSTPKKGVKKRPKPITPRTRVLRTIINFAQVFGDRV
jgi:hypothetical protein